MLRFLNCGADSEQLAQATLRRESSELEESAAAAHIPMQIVRSKEEFEATEQGKIHAKLPLIYIEKIGESDPIPLPKGGDQPLSGIRCLSMVHAVAGPCCPRTLAGAGADCLNIDMPDWIEYGNFFFQADIGLRQAYLDARLAENRKHVYKLIEGADVFVDNLRPGVTDAEGYSHQALAERKPGIICVSVKLMAHQGPMSNFCGFDINAGGVSGLAVAEGTADQPMPPQQVQVICDIMTGYLGAIGVKAALLRRAKEGGSYSIRISLTQCVQYIMSLGFNEKRVIENLADMGPEHQIMAPNLITGMTGFGEVTKPGSQVEMSKTPQAWADPILHVPGTCKLEWL